ncbi:hypothetical protein [Streptomyces sp. NPDC059468]|uniref:hypothetical protein n=1 Tax=unclassified Streptomyces TaxID=2593676 RepID=UPI0036C133A7
MASTASRTASSCQALTVLRSMIFCPAGSAWTSSGVVGPPHAVGRGGGDDQQDAQDGRRPRHGHHVVLQLAERDVPDAGQKSHLVVDQHHGGVLPGVDSRNLLRSLIFRSFEGSQASLVTNLDSQD